MADDSTMKSDHIYAEMLEMMRAQGAKDNPSIPVLGEMQSANSVKIDDLVLNAEDLYIADYLVSGYTRKIKVPYVPGVTVDTTQSNITYADGLKAGDLVLVQALANNKYAIIVRVVEA